MKAIEIHSKAKCTQAPREMKSPFHVVHLYDEPQALEQAERIVESLLSKCLQEVDVHRDELSFSEVIHPQLLAESVELAAECDLFVFATTDGAVLPIEVVVWLDLWLRSRAQKDAALVSLVGAPGEMMLNSPVHLYLRHLADRHGLAFFSTSFMVPEKRSNLSEPRQASSCAAWINYSPSPEGWGIND